MKNLHLSCIFSALMVMGFAAEPTEPYDQLVVKKIHINIENQAPGDINESQAVLLKLQTKKGANFNQEIFDKDLKRLSDEYEWVEPRIKVENREAIITLDIQKRPIVSRFQVVGNSYYSQRKILSEGDLSVGMSYNRENFYKSIHKIREFLIQKGFFKAEVSYTAQPVPGSSEIAISLQITEGPVGHINDICFKGFTPEEEKEALEVIRASKFNVLYSWLTGAGYFKEAELEPDVQALVNYFQNKGYADAHVTIAVEEYPMRTIGPVTIEESPKTRVRLVISLDKGVKYTFRNVSFEGETIVAEALLKKASRLKTGDVFSVDKIRESQEKLKELYTKDGYLHTNIDYSLNLNAEDHSYDITFKIEESKQYRVGLVMVSGNYSTTKNVVYNNIAMEPGEIFNSNKVKATQEQLRSTGFFENVNVYPLKCEQTGANAPEYCDVMVEVNEAKTGNASMFVGFSSTDNVFGGVDLTETNFNIGGLSQLWAKGPCCLRGGGQYFQLKGQIGARESEIGASWMDPYYNDTLWRVGADINYGVNSVVSTQYTFRTLGGGLSAKYPLSQFVLTGVRGRIKNSNIFITPVDPVETDAGKKAGNEAEKKEEEEQKAKNRQQRIAAGWPDIIQPDDKQNSGLVAGLAFTIGYDSVDNPMRPRSGVRSGFEFEFAGLARKIQDLHDFPFLKFGFVNSLYYPVWSKGTIKLRGDFKFISPLFGGKSTQLPLSERFFLGGEGTVRGYSPGKLGPYYNDNPDKPTGGISSILLSAEYCQKIVKPLDVFVFLDAGSISLSQFSINKIQAAYGIGVRVDIGRGLPFVVGYGRTIGTEPDKVTQPLFFSMAGQF